MPSVGIFGLPEGYLTVSEFAEKIGVSENTIRKVINRHKIDNKFFRDGQIVEGSGIIIIHESELDKFPK